MLRAYMSFAVAAAAAAAPAAARAAPRRMEPEATILAAPPLEQRPPPVRREPWQPAPTARRPGRGQRAAARAAEGRAALLQGQRQSAAAGPVPPNGGEEEAGGGAREPTAAGHTPHDNKGKEVNTGGGGPHGGGSSGAHGRGGPRRPKPPFDISLKVLAHILTVLLCIELLAAALFEWSHHKWVNVDFGRPLPAVAETRHTPLGRMFTSMPQLMRPYFHHPRGSKGRRCMLAIVVMSLLCLFFSFVHNTWQKEWWDLFNKADAARFPQLMGVYVVLVGGWMMNGVYKSYIQSWLYIDWREFMTCQFMTQWLSSHSHFLIELNRGSGGHKRVDNPEQRLQEDIHLFVNDSLEIVPEFLNSVGHLVVFVPILLWLEPEKAFGIVRFPGWLLYLAFIYSAIGSLATHLIGWPMINYSFAKQRYEADFRRAALHVRDQAESVALYGSEATEEARLRQQFERIKLVQWRQMMLTKRLSFFTTSYGFVQFLVPFFILAPSYFRKDLSLGDLFQLTGAIGSVANSFDWFLRVYGALTSWLATAERLLAFEAAIAGVQGQAAHCAAGRKRDYGSGGGNGTEEAGNPAIGEHAAGASHRPSTANGVSGDHGHDQEGSLQALAGVWPHVTGSCVRLPVDNPEQVLFVPQRPALPKRCSLGQALAYPELRSSYSDEAMLKVLRDVRLEQLALEAPPEAADDCAASSGGDFEEESPERAPEGAGAVDAADLAGGGDSTGVGPALGLNRVEDWGSRLSPGQQQRLAIGHVLLRRPMALFLDEVTANVGKESAAELYRTVFQRLPPGAVVVSISHDVDILEPLHDVHLTACDGESSAKQLRTLKSPGSRPPS